MIEEDNIKTTSSYELRILDILSDIKQLDIYSLRQIFLLLTQNYFADPHNFAASGISLPDKFYKYTFSNAIVDPKHKYDSTIDINLDYTSSADSIDKSDYLKTNNQPSIYISIGDINYQKAILDNHLKTGYLGNIKGVLATTNITISHYANNYDDAAIMSYLTSSFYLGMREPLKNKLKLLDFNVLQTSSPKLSEDASTKALKYFKSDVTLKLDFEANWESNIEAVLLRKVSIDILAK